MGFDILNLQRGRGPVQAKSKADEGRPVLKYIDVDDLVPSEDNFYSMTAIEELADLIELSGGVKQPALVSPMGGGKYKVIAGHRRRLASLQLVKQGKEAYRKMPCMVEDGEREPGEEAAELRAINEAILLITTNGQREKTDWDKVQEATRLRELLERKRKFERIPGETRKIIAERLGTTPAQVGRYDSIAKHLIPEFTEALKKGRVNISVAYELSKMEEWEQRSILGMRNPAELSIDAVKRMRESVQTNYKPPAQTDVAQEPETPAPVEREPVVTTATGSGPVVVNARPEPGKEPKEAFVGGLTVEPEEAAAPIPSPAAEREQAEPVREPERMSNTRARMVLEDLVQYCEMEAEVDNKWLEYVEALAVAIEKLRGR